MRSGHAPDIPLERRCVVNHAQARRLLNPVRDQTPSGLRLVAFFAVLYYTGLWPEEAVGLRRENVLASVTYRRAGDKARKAALTPAEYASPWHGVRTISGTLASQCGSTGGAPRGAVGPDGGERPLSPRRRSGGVKLEAA